MAGSADNMRPVAAADLAAYGLLPKGDCAIQMDITAVLRPDGDRLIETYLCDHNCTVSHRGRPTGGHYNCPAAFSLNRGAIASTTSSADQLMSGITRLAAAAKQANREFLADEFVGYAAEFRLPEQVAAMLKSAMSSPRSEVTLFGGSPEAHPEVTSLITGLRERGFDVQITMTGRRAMRDPDTFHRLAAAAPEVVAVSIDDVGSGELPGLLDASPAQLRAAWKSVSPLHGQRQKVFEALHLARLWDALPGHERPGLLVNMAVHQGNVHGIGRVLDLLSSALPGAQLNPFPMQSAFERRTEDFDEEVRRELAAFVDDVIADHHASAAGRQPRWRIVRRLHYWLLLAAAATDDPTSRRLTGWNTWQCFRSAGAGRYVQIAGTGQMAQGSLVAGGRVGCFWNDTLNDQELPAIWQASEAQLREYLKLRPALAARRPGACPGCLFPRLVGDMVSADLGMDPTLRERYLALRRTHLGF